MRLRGVFGRELGSGRERLPGKEPGKLSNSDISFASIALFCFIFKALFSQKFMPLSSSETELESVTEFSEGSGWGWGRCSFAGCSPGVSFLFLFLNLFILFI